MDGGTSMHRRKSSKDLEEEELVIPVPQNSATRPPSIILAPPPGNRSHPSYSRSTSIAGTSSLNPGMVSDSAYAGPYQTTVNGFPNGRPINGINGSNASSSASPLKTTFGHSHSRTRSISGPFAPPQPSPLAASFPSSVMSSSLSSPSINSTPFPSQLTASPSEDVSAVSPNDSSTSLKQSRRHSRLHSRNLSIFFPRPGSLPTSSIAEDGSQELEVKDDIEAPVSTIPSAGPSVQFPRSQSMNHGRAPPTPLGAGFTFGGRPSAISTPTPPSMESLSSSSSSSMSSIAKSRRGHHHKHSMSHSFFSFLEPGADGVRPNGVPVSSVTPVEALHTQPTPVPVSPWSHTTPSPSLSQTLDHETDSSEGVPLGPAMGALGQFLLGAWLWVCGQRIGSLSCTGVGYWVVFDSFGVGVAKVLPGWLNLRNELVNAREQGREALKRPYGNKRVMTVFMFAQAVYLLFSAVYICKETIEHILLITGHGHHHHAGEDDDWIGIEFPPLMTLVTFGSIISTALLYNNHAKLIDVTGNRIPTPLAFLHSLTQTSHVRNNFNTPASANTTLANSVSNPYITSPLLFCLAMFGIAVFLPPTQHHPADLVLASFIALITFKVSYRACTVLGTVLLQTAPVRGLSSGKMETFLRVMREVERHPNVLHLPAPHIWQLTPSSVHSMKDEAGETLIVTLDLHVREDLGDDEILALTKWASERISRALGSAGGGTVNVNGSSNGSALSNGVAGGEKVKGGVEVTVGVVRG